MVEVSGRHTRSTGEDTGMRHICHVVTVDVLPSDSSDLSLLSHTLAGKVAVVVLIRAVGTGMNHSCRVVTASALPPDLSPILAARAAAVVLQVVEVTSLRYSVPPLLPAE